jgi:hypothetical protein
MWLFLPAGTLLLVASLGVLYAAFWAIPSRTIGAFELDGGRLTLRTLRGRAIVHDVASLERIEPVRSQGRLQGWRLVFRGPARRGRVFIERDLPFADDLVDELTSRLPKPY